MNQKIAQNLKKVRSQINKKKEPGQEVRLVAVTKTRLPEQISAAIEAGVFSIGENRVQEAELKWLETKRLINQDIRKQLLLLKKVKVSILQLVFNLWH